MIGASIHFQPFIFGVMKGSCFLRWNEWDWSVIKRIYRIETWKMLLKRSGGARWTDERKIRKCQIWWVLRCIVMGKITRKVHSWEWERGWMHLRSYWRRSQPTGPWPADCAPAHVSVQHNGKLVYRYVSVRWYLRVKNKIHSCVWVHGIKSPPNWKINLILKWGDANFERKAKPEPKLTHKLDNEKIEIC